MIGPLVTNQFLGSVVVVQELILINRFFQSEQGPLPP
jgi:hypothetical protein